MQIVWIKNLNTSEWFDFLRLNLDAAYFTDKYGVYVIWYTSPAESNAESKVIRLGQGNIGERLRAHRTDPSILRYANIGQLKVSWAVLNNFSKMTIDGIERFLAESYRPLIGDRFPEVDTIPVNLIE